MVVYRGWQGLIKYGDTTIGQVEGWSVEVDNSTEAHFAVGSRTATDITVGSKNVTGSFSKVWFDDDYADYAADPDTKPASFNFNANIKGDADNISITCKNCIWTTWGGSGEAEGYAVEDLDFICKNIDT